MTGVDQIVEQYQTVIREQRQWNLETRSDVSKIKAERDTAVALLSQLLDAFAVSSDYATWTDEVHRLIGTAEDFIELKVGR